MNGKNGRYLAEIKAAIKDGTLTGSEIRRRLIASIDKELEKPEQLADMEFIRVAHAILREMHRSTIVVDDEALEVSLKCAQKKMAASEKHRIIKRFTIRTILATAAVFVVLAVGDGIFHWEWLSGKPTDDQQQYVVSGHEIDPSLIEKGNAADADVYRETTTTDLSEAVTVLGFTPPIPSWFPDEWELKNYYAHANNLYQIFTLNLASEESEKPISYSVTRFSHMEDAEAAFEQNELGVRTSVNDRSIYLTMNYDLAVAIWHENNICYSLHAPVPEETIIQIVKSILKE